MLTRAKYSFLVILRPNQRFFAKTQQGGLLTFCPVNLKHESLMNLENSGSLPSLL
jgi:hypothetical protein